MAGKYASQHSLTTSPYGPRAVDEVRPAGRLHIFSVRGPETPMEREGRENLERVRQWYMSHLGGKQRECAEALGLSVMAVNRHVAKLRAEWDDK